VVLIIWDLASEEGLQKAGASYLAGAAGAIFIGDLGRSETIGNIPSRVRAFEDANPGSAGIIVLNKTDLVSGGVDVEGISRSAGLPADFPVFCTSCKTGENVEGVFTSLASRFLG